MSKKRETEGCAVNMTPMIDVVFQLIIFFIVTINIADAKDETVRLELGTHGQEVESGETKASALVIDVSRKGRISIGNVEIRPDDLKGLMARRFKLYGNNFQVWVRGDARATHKQIRKVMDTCTASGVGRVSFIAVKDARTKETKKFLTERNRSRR